MVVPSLDNRKGKGSKMETFYDTLARWSGRNPSSVILADA